MLTQNIKMRFVLMKQVSQFREKYDMLDEKRL